MAAHLERWRAGRLAGFPAACLAAACLTGCGSSTRNLNTAKIERSIAQSILSEHGLHVSVTCPSKVREQAGRVFTCSANLNVGAYPVAVTEVGGDGRVRYSGERPLIALNIAKVERSIESSVSSQRHLRAAVSCPPEVLQRAGVVFRCVAVIDRGGRRYPFVVSEIDNAGHVRYVGV